MPKPMIAIGDRPILWHIMKYYASWGHNEFILCLGYKARRHQEVLPQLQRGALERLRALDGGQRRRAARQRHRRLADHVRRHRGRSRRSAERLVAVAPHLGDDEYFLANYGDGLTDAPLDRHDRATASSRQDRPVPVRAPASQRSRASMTDEDGLVRSIKTIRTPTSGSTAASSSSARDLRPHRPGRGPGGRAVRAADRSRRADRLPLRRLLGADGHVQGQAASRRAGRSGRALAFGRASACSELEPTECSVSRSRSAPDQLRASSRSAAHADDIEIGCGGTLLALTQAHPRST